jgi:hypothetical protein
VEASTELTPQAGVNDEVACQPGIRAHQKTHENRERSRCIYADELLFQRNCNASKNAAWFGAGVVTKPTYMNPEPKTKSVHISEVPQTATGAFEPRTPRSIETISRSSVRVVVELQIAVEIIVEASTPKEADRQADSLLPEPDLAEQVNELVEDFVQSRCRSTLSREFL